MIHCFSTIGSVSLFFLSISWVNKQLAIVMILFILELPIT